MRPLHAAGVMPTEALHKDLSDANFPQDADGQV